MSTIDAKLVKELREKTGAKMMACKEALVEANGDAEKARDILRKKGEASADKRAGRATGEGALGSYIHSNGKIGVLIEVGCETDFVARNEEFQTLLKDLCMHIAAAKPQVLTRDELDEKVVAGEREVFAAQVKGKPENVVDKIVTGKLEKYYSEVCLVDQPFVKEPKLSIGQLVKQKAGKIGENIQIHRFVRWELGGA